MRRFRRIVFVLVLLALALVVVPPEPAGRAIAPGSALVLELAGEYVEAAEPPLLARLLGDGRHSVRRAALRAAQGGARRAPRGRGAAHARPRDRLGARPRSCATRSRALRARGRRVIAYLEIDELRRQRRVLRRGGGRRGPRRAGDALAADRARGRVPLPGRAAGRSSASTSRWSASASTRAPPRRSPSARCATPNREMANSLLDSIDAQFVAGIAEGAQARRPRPCARAIDDAPISPEQLKKLRPDRRRSSSGTSSSTSSAASTSSSRRRTTRASTRERWASRRSRASR